MRFRIKPIASAILTAFALMLPGASAAPLPLYQPKMQSAMNGGGFGITNLGSLAVTNIGVTNLVASNIYVFAFDGPGTNRFGLGGGGGGIATNGGSGFGNTLSNLMTSGDVDFRGYALSNMSSVNFVGFSCAYVSAFDSGNIIAASGKANYAAMIGGAANTIAPTNTAFATRGALVGGHFNALAPANGGTAEDSAVIGGTVNIIGAGTSLADNSAIIAGDGNRIGTGASSAAHSAILSGQSNSISINAGAAFWDVILGGKGNTINSSLYSAIVGGKDGLITNSSDNSVILAGIGNTILGATNSIAAGSLSKATNNNVFIWSDGTSAFSSKTNKQFIVSAANGVGIGTNNPGTNAMRVKGNLDVAGPGAGFTVNGQPFVSGGTNYIYTIGTNTSFLLGIDISPESAATNYWWDFNQTNAAGSRAIYQSILATANVNFLGVTNIQRWDLLSFDVVASGGPRTITFPTNLFRMKTNGLSISGTSYSYLLENGKLFRGSIHTNAALEFIWNATDQ